MADSPVIQLVTLWFVILIFLQTSSGDTGGIIPSVIGVPAVLLAYILPLTIVIYGILVLIDR